MAEQVTVYVRPGRTVYLPGGVHGFTHAMGPVTMAAEHAQLLAPHLIDDKQCADGSITEASALDAGAADAAPQDRAQARRGAVKDAPAS